MENKLSIIELHNLIKKLDDYHQVKFDLELKSLEENNKELFDGLKDYVSFYHEAFYNFTYDFMSRNNDKCSSLLDKQLIQSKLLDRINCNKQLEKDEVKKIGPFSNFKLDVDLAKKFLELNSTIRYYILSTYYGSNELSLNDLELIKSTKKDDINILMDNLMNCKKSYQDGSMTRGEFLLLIDSTIMDIIGYSINGNKEILISYLESELKKFDISFDSKKYDGDFDYCMMDELYNDIFTIVDKNLRDFDKVTISIEETINIEEIIRTLATMDDNGLCNYFSNLLKNNRPLYEKLINYLSVIFLNSFHFFPNVKYDSRNYLKEIFKQINFAELIINKRNKLTIGEHKNLDFIFAANATVMNSIINEEEFDIKQIRNLIDLNKEILRLPRVVSFYLSVHSDNFSDLNITNALYLQNNEDIINDVINDIISMIDETLMCRYSYSAVLDILTIIISITTQAIQGLLKLGYIDSSKFERYMVGLKKEIKESDIKYREVPTYFVESLLCKDLAILVAYGLEEKNISRTHKNNE